MTLATPSPVRHDAGPLAEAARWGPVTLPLGRFSLHDVNLKRDVPLVREWPGASRDFLAARTARPHGAAYLGCLDDEPVGLWDLYRAGADPIAAHYPARPGDVGLTMLLAPAVRAAGLAAPLAALVTGMVLQADPRARRVVAVPALGDRSARAAFARAGFCEEGELPLAGGPVVLMTRGRT